MTDDKPARRRSAPPPDAPLRFIKAALAAWIVLLGYVAMRAPAIAADFRHNQATLVATHLFTLAFLSALALGVLYQFVPVAYATEFPSPTNARLTFWHFIPGAWVLAAGFALDRSWLVALGGSLVLAGAAFAWSEMHRLFSTSRTPTPGMPLVRLALVYLALTLLFGIFLALNGAFGWLADERLLAAHAALGLIGWFGTLVAGVSHKLIPMFSASVPPSPGLMRWLSWLFGLAPLTVAAGSAGGLVWLAVSGGLIELVAFALYFGAIIYGVAHRASIRAQLDVAVRGGVTSLFVMLAVTVTALALGSLGSPVSPRQVVGLAYLWAMGGLAMLATALLHRIAPFLTWLREYGGRKLAGRAPLHEELYRHREAPRAWWILAAGTWATGLAMLLELGDLAVRLAALVSLAGGILWTNTMVAILGHKSMVGDATPPT